MKKPLVTVICPLSPERKHELDNVRQQFAQQDYKRLQTLLIDVTDKNIGTKRNELTKMAKGEIIVAMDSDDIYAPDWVSRSVDFLLSNPTVMITGLNSAYFRKDNQLYLWEYNGSKKHVCEGTMTYYKKIWGGTKVFGNTSQGEGQQFLQGNGKILPHSYIDGFQAQLHGANTSSHLSLHKFKFIKHL